MQIHGSKEHMNRHAGASTRRSVDVVIAAVAVAIAVVAEVEEVQ